MERRNLAWIGTAVAAMALVVGAFIGVTRTDRAQQDEAMAIAAEIAAHPLPDWAAREDRRLILAAEGYPWDRRNAYAVPGSLWAIVIDRGVGRDPIITVERRSELTGFKREW